MTIDQVPAGGSVFIDANILVYHFERHPQFGPSCQRLIERVERQDIEGITSTNLLGEIGHRLMMIEAAALPGAAGGRALNRLKQQPAVVQQLSRFQTAIEAILQSQIRVVTVATTNISRGAAISRHFGLLTNDALTLALMQHYGLSNIASNDADFDRVPGITRYAPS